MKFIDIKMQSRTIKIKNNKIEKVVLGCDIYISIFYLVKKNVYSIRHLL